MYGHSDDCVQKRMWLDVAAGRGQYCLFMLAFAMFGIIKSFPSYVLTFRARPTSLINKALFTNVYMHTITFVRREN